MSIFCLDAKNADLSSSCDSLQVWSSLETTPLHLDGVSPGPTSETLEDRELGFELMACNPRMEIISSFASHLHILMGLASLPLVGLDLHSLFFLATGFLTWLLDYFDGLASYFFYLLYYPFSFTGYSNPFFYACTSS